jgi:translation initiation factor IF-1
MEIDNGHVIYVFTRGIEGRYRIRSGDIVIVHTPDCFGGLDME